MGNLQSVLNPGVQPVAREGPQEFQTAHADMQRAQKHSSEFRSLEYLIQDPEPSEDLVGRRRRRRQEPEPRQTRRKQPPCSASTQTKTLPAIAVKAELGAVQAEQAGASKSEDIHSAQGRQAISIEAVAVADVPHPGGHAALAATGVAQAQTEAGPAGKRPSRMARKSTAGATRKAPAVRVKKEAPAEVERVKEEVDLKVEIKVKKEAKVKKEVKVKKEIKAKSGLKLQAGVGVIGKVLSRAEMNAALAGLKRAEPDREMKHASGEASICDTSIHSEHVLLLLAAPFPGHVC